MTRNLQENDRDTLICANSYSFLAIFSRLHSGPVASDLHEELFEFQSAQRQGHAACFSAEITESHNGRFVSEQAAQKAQESMIMTKGWR